MSDDFTMACRMKPIRAEERDGRVIPYVFQYNQSISRPDSTRGTGTTPGSGNQRGNYSLSVRVDLSLRDSPGVTPGSGQQLIHYAFRHMAQHPGRRCTNHPRSKCTKTLKKSAMSSTQRHDRRDHRDDSRRIAELISLLSVWVGRRPVNMTY